ADHVHARVETAALAAGEALGLLVAGEKEADLVEAPFDQLRIDAAAAFVDGEMRCPDRGGSVEVFLDGEEGIKCFILRDDGDVGFEVVVFGVEIDAIEINASAARFELSAEGFEEGAFA